MTRYTPEILQSVRDMMKQGKTAIEIGRSLPSDGGKTPDALRGRGRRAMELAGLGADDTRRLKELPQDTTNTTENTLTVTRITDRQITNLEELKAFCKLDEEVWEVDTWECNSWGMGYKNNSGVGVTHPLWQVKAKFKRRHAYIATTAAVKASIEKLLTKLLPTQPPTEKIYPRDTPVLAVISMPDLHLGKIASSKEVGTEYNLEIATKLYKNAFWDIYQDARPRKLGKIVFPIGNDLFNFDNLIGTTTAGTQQKQAHLYQEIFVTAQELMVWSIDQLLNLAPVEIISVPGNHDSLSAWTLTQTLRAYYRGNRALTVDNSPAPRKTSIWGCCGIMFTHGKEEKWSSLPLIMMRENHKVWSQITFPEIHLAHRHTTMGLKVDYEEMNGIRIRILPSLSGTDSWHFGKGYIGNIRAAESYYYHKNVGLVGTGVSNVVE